MTRWTWIVAIALGACDRTPSARERALSYLPRDADLIAAADGRALASPAFRKAIDAIRPRVPASFGCVVDAALTADAVAVTSAPDGIAVVAISSHPVTCPALARIERDVWTATVGAPGRARGALAVARWQRARGVLLSAPVALAVDVDGVHAIAALQLAPGAGWLTIDSPDPDAVERAARDWLARLHATQLALVRDRGQIRITAGELADAELGALAEAGVRALDAARGAVPAFGCPQRDPIILSCREAPGRIEVAVRALPSLVEAWLRVPIAPVIENGEVIGVRADAATLVLDRGDVVLGVDGHRVRNRNELVDRLVAAHGHLAIEVRRDGRAAVVDVVGSE